MFKKIGQLLVTALALALLVYSASRSYNFISLTLPPDRQILAWFGLAALDGGLLCWILAYLYGSHGGWQRGISLLMVIIDLLGCVLMFTADSLYETGKSGLTVAFNQEEMMMFTLALSGIIAINIAATVAHHLTDPAKLKQQSEEEAFGKIEDLALKKLGDNADSLAAELAPQIADDWMVQTRARYRNLLGKNNGLALPSPTTIDAHAKDVPERKRRFPSIYVPRNRNGKEVYQSETVLVEPTSNLPIRRSTGGIDVAPCAGRVLFGCQKVYDIRHDTPPGFTKIGNLWYCEECASKENPIFPGNSREWMNPNGHPKGG